MTDADRRRAGTGGLPLATAAFVVCATLVEWTPGLASRLILEREAIARGELWRLLTGHLVHGVPGLALYDLAAFALFGAWIERSSRRLFAAVLVSSALASSLAVLLLSGYERYVGASALTGGLVAAALLRLATSARPRPARLLALALLLAFAGRAALALLGTRTDSLVPLPEGHESAAVAHLAGALAGSAVALATRYRRT